MSTSGILDSDCLPYDERMDPWKSPPNQVSHTMEGCSCTNSPIKLKLFGKVFHTPMDSMSRKGVCNHDHSGAIDEAAHSTSGTGSGMHCNPEWKHCSFPWASSLNGSCAESDGKSGGIPHHCCNSGDYINVQNSRPFVCSETSTLNAISGCDSMHVDNDERSALSFVPKKKAPTELSRADIFGEDPPTPWSSTYCDANSQSTSGTDAIDDHIADIRSQPTGDSSQTECESAVPDCVFVRAPFDSDLEYFFTPSSPSTNTVSSCENEIDFVAATTQLVSRVLFNYHTKDEAFKAHLGRSFVPQHGFTTQPPPRAHDEEASHVEICRSTIMTRLREKMMAYSLHRAMVRAEKTQCILKDEEKAQVEHWCFYWPFKKSNKNVSDGQPTTTTLVHVIEYDNRGRHRLETRVKHEQKKYVEDDEFSFIRGSWRWIHPLERWRPRKQRSAWYHLVRP